MAGAASDPMAPKSCAEDAEGGESRRALIGTTGTMDELHEFFEGYRQALERADVDAVVAAYRTPLPVIRPDRTVLVETPQTLRVEILKILDFYRWSGMRRLGMADLRADGYDPGMHVVSLSWRPTTASGEEVASIDVTYAVRRTTNGARICAVIAHNEERRRAPIIRESLDALED